MKGKVIWKEIVSWLCLCALRCSVLVLVVARDEYSIPTFTAYVALPFLRLAGFAACERNYQKYHQHFVSEDYNAGRALGYLDEVNIRKRRTLVVALFRAKCLRKQPGPVSVVSRHRREPRPSCVVLTTMWYPELTLLNFRWWPRKRSSRPGHRQEIIVVGGLRLAKI